jgi:hypothetical protein
MRLLFRTDFLPAEFDVPKPNTCRALRCLGTTASCQTCQVDGSTSLPVKLFCVGDEDDLSDDLFRCGWDVRLGGEGNV